MMKTKQTVIVLIGLMMILGACQQTPEQVLVEPTATVDAEPDATATPRTPVGVTVVADGKLVAARPALPLGFAVGGELAELLVAVGDRVSAGDVVARLDTTPLEAALELAQINVEKAERDLAQQQASAEIDLQIAQSQVTETSASVPSLTAAQVRLDQAILAEQRAQEEYNKALDRPWEPPEVAESYKRGLESATAEREIAQAEVDQLLNQQWAASQQVVAAEARAEQADQTVENLALGIDPALQWEVEKAQRELSEAELIAPWDGQVLTVDAAEGATVGSGSAVVTLLDTASLEFHTTNLSERDFAQIEPGQRARVVLKAYPDEPIMATVLRIGLEADGEVGDAATFPVVLALDATELDVRPGMTGRVELLPAE